jgi:hypothetical protein
MEEFRSKLADARIEAEPEMVFNANMSNIIAYSQSASLVFFPFRLKGDQPLDPFDNPIEQILSDLPTTALVLAAEDIVLESEPDTGKAGEIASAFDARADAEKKLRRAQKEAGAALKKVTDLKEQLAKMDSEAAKNSMNPSAREELVAALTAAEAEAEKAKRRAAKAQAKAETAARAAENLGIKPSRPENEAEAASDPESK